MKKILALVLVMCVGFSFSACKKSGGKNLSADSSLSEEEINSQYEEMMKENEEILDEGYNPIIDSFTQTDFQLTKTDDTTAFNLPENSFAKIGTDKTAFAFFDASLPSQSFPGEFKTCKGMSLKNSVNEVIASYKIDRKNVISKKGEGLYVEYNEEYDAENISFAFRSDDGVSFSSATQKDLLNIIQNRDFSGSESIPESDMDKVLKDSQTVAIIDIVPSDEGGIQSIKISRFDKNN